MSACIFCNTRLCFGLYQDSENAEASDAGQIQAIEATDVSMFQSAARVLF